MVLTSEVEESEMMAGSVSFLIREELTRNGSLGPVMGPVLVKVKDELADFTKLFLGRKIEDIKEAFCCR